MFLPSDVTWMSSGKKGVPLLARKLFDGRPSLQGLARAGSAEDEHSRIARVMQDSQYVTMFDWSPQYIAFFGPRMIRRGKSSPCPRNAFTVARADPVR